MRVVVLANRASGARASRRNRAQAVGQALEEAGVHPELHFLAGPQLQEAARRAVAGGADAVVAAGGDGTVSAVAGAVAGSKAVLGVLPLGTLNHFARDAGLPTALAEAAGVVAAGRIQRVDVAEVNGRIFVNNSSIGLYPSTVREREGRGGPKPLATATAALAVLRRLPSHRVTLIVDGHPERRTTPCVFVGNNPYETGFGRLGRRASLDTGRLGLCTIRAASRWALLALTARALAGRLDNARELELQEAEAVTIASAHRRTLRVALDGEVARLQLPLRYRIRPRALRLLAPRRR